MTIQATDKLTSVTLMSSRTRDGNRKRTVTKRLTLCLCQTRQMYLLTPMDRVTLPHAKSPIPNCTPSEIARQQALQAIFKAHCYTNRHLSATSTYIHGKAQTPLGRFVGCRRIIQASLQQIHKKSNRLSLSLSVLTSNAIGARNRSPSSTTLLISVNGVP